jgi:hypothetical protein
MSLDYHLVDPLGDDEQDEQQSDVLDGFTALRSTPELASPGVKISFLFKGFLLLFPIHDPIEFS